MATAEKSIDVDVPVQTAYDQWTQCESFPRFMDAVEEVRQLDDKTLQWRATIGGNFQEWEAVIVEQIPDSRIEWRSTDGAQNSGVVSFSPVSDNCTRVFLQIGYEPQGLAQGIGDAMGMMSRQIEDDLENFKEFIENRGTETGAWRGQIEEGTTASPTGNCRTGGNQFLGVYGHAIIGGILQPADGP